MKICKQSGLFFFGLFLFCAEDGGGGAGERWEGQLHVYA
jgi:hypothetical protein